MGKIDKLWADELPDELVEETLDQLPPDLVKQMAKAELSAQNLPDQIDWDGIHALADG